MIWPIIDRQGIAAQCPERDQSRLKALEAKIAAEGGILTEAQVQALEKKKLDDEACGEIETAHPTARQGICKMPKRGVIWALRTRFMSGH